MQPRRGNWTIRPGPDTDADGCMLDGTILYPPDFDPKQRYPVWVQVYGGPHAPRIRKAFISRERDQLLANWGLIVFCVDPRSAAVRDHLDLDSV